MCVLGERCLLLFCVLFVCFGVLFVLFACLLLFVSFFLVLFCCGEGGFVGCFTARIFSDA